MPKLENLFASRFLKARKRNKLLSFLSITSVVGVMLGVSALITVISVMNGFTANLKEKFLGAEPHITVNNMTGVTINGWEDLAAEIAALPYVTGVSPYVTDQAVITTERKVNGVIVRGIIPDDEEFGAGLNLDIIRGSWGDIAVSGNDDLPGILVGKEILFSLGLVTGSKITLMSSAITQGAFGIIPKMRRFRVAGYFDAGFEAYNKSLIYMDLKQAQDFFGIGNSISGIGVMVKNPDKAESIANSMQTELNRDEERFLWVSDWLSRNGKLFDALKLEEYALFVILTLIIIVASFSIVSMITVTVKDKRKDVAILRAMGASEKLIRNIFTRQGIIIGALGTALGDLLAFVLCFALKNFKIIKVPKDIYFSDTIPVLISPRVFITVTICALLITYVAAVLPARISAKTDPIEAIRND
ncbi:MAG: ABC transporter permease [Deferribacteraceae bacterium]|jgi:lipoprotein-releasing system permease protein|nr:ABC transporter permease [Deferribacteraceae bacterium]